MTRPSAERHGGRLVLVADDEPSLRRSLSLMLASAGFSTVEAHDGVQAVELVKARADIQVALIDASMPGMGGVEAARKILDLRRDLPIVMMSGYTHEPLVGVETITKPFEPDSLLEILRSLTSSVE
ncbi:MAG: hypothetical protein BGO98_46945 [Myxococcales bacterium 68-20]|nr:response regulator [Myxococcales bacterium]OJY23119.1 MAG: hypothetical protein BGO98_46945 [Myxococcales bacterium 68-20]